VLLIININIQAAVRTSEVFHAAQKVFHKNTVLDILNRIGEKLFIFNLNSLNFQKLKIKSIIMLNDKVKKL